MKTRDCKICSSFSLVPLCKACWACDLWLTRLISHGRALGEQSRARKEGVFWCTSAACSGFSGWVPCGCLFVTEEVEV